jgi:hypothetical protein
MSGCGEQASPHLVIDVVIQAAAARSPEGSLRQVPGLLTWQPISMRRMAVTCCLVLDIAQGVQTG